MKRRLVLVIALLVLPAPSFAQVCHSGVIDYQDLFFSTLGKRIGDNADNWRTDTLRAGFVRALVNPNEPIDISKDYGLRVQWRSDLNDVAPIVFTPSSVPDSSLDEAGNVLLWYTVTRQFIQDDSSRPGYVHGRDFVYSWTYKTGNTNAEMRIPCTDTPPIEPPQPPQPPHVPPVIEPPTVPPTAPPIITGDLEKHILDAIERIHVDLTAQHQALREAIDEPGWFSKVMKNPIVIAAESFVGGYLANLKWGK